MKKSAAVALAAVLAFVPVLVSAHEHQQFEIGHQVYEFGIGSLNEPLVVDDKSGVELSVSMVGHEEMAANDHHAEGGAVVGLEETLQVELIAGSQKKILPLSPIYGEPGSYKAPFYPTVATTLSYRVFGELNGTPVDLLFTCSPAGHAAAEDDTTEVEVSEGVTRILKSGAFGCPVEKEVMGFPEPSADIQSLKNSGGGMSAAALGLSVIALGAALVAGRRKS